MRAWSLDLIRRAKWALWHCQSWKTQAHLEDGSAARQQGVVYSLNVVRAGVVCCGRWSSPQPARAKRVSLSPEGAERDPDQLKKGASQIKLAVGGGVISDFDPIDGLQFTPEELRAAVQAASDWGTYVATHVYTAAGIRRALKAGVRSIEHGHLADEATVKLITEKGAWLSMQPFEPGNEKLSPENLEKT